MCHSTARFFEFTNSNLFRYTCHIHLMWKSYDKIMGRIQRQSLHYFCNTNHHSLVTLLVVLLVALELSFSALGGCFNHNELQRYCMLSSRWFNGVWNLGWVWSTLHTHPPMKMEQCSKTPAFKLQTPVTHPEESIQHSEHGESLKSRTNKISKNKNCLWSL
jgi:hypothetical protein